MLNINKGLAKQIYTCNLSKTIDKTNQSLSLKDLIKKKYSNPYNFCLSSRILMDINFLELNRVAKRLRNQNYSGINQYKQTRGLVHLKQKDFKRLNSILKQDAKFLASHNIMDYSMILAVENSEFEYDDPACKEKLKLSRNMCLSEYDAKNSAEIYHFGIIDFF